MTTHQDTYWNELGVTWTASIPDIKVMMPRLKQRLHHQSLLIKAGLLIGLPVSLAGLALGMFTIWIGATTGAWNFVVRGIALIALALITGRAVFLLRSVCSDAAANSLSAMLDLAIARAQRSLLLIQLCLYACLVAGVFGIAGTVVRTSLSAPPQQSPFIDLLLLALFALALVLSRGYVKASLQKMTALSRLLANTGDN